VEARITDPITRATMAAAQSDEVKCLGIDSGGDDVREAKLGSSEGWT
jgi:hypothetical protein